MSEKQEHNGEKPVNCCEAVLAARAYSMAVKLSEGRNVMVAGLGICDNKDCQNGALCLPDGSLMRFGECAVRKLLTHKEEPPTDRPLVTQNMRQ